MMKRRATIGKNQDDDPENEELYSDDSENEDLKNEDETKLE